MNIFKYELSLADMQTIRMPKGASIISLQIQREEPCIWAMVPDQEPGNEELRTFITIGTGNHFKHDPKYVYIGTYQKTLEWRIFVGHVFEIK